MKKLTVTAALAISSLGFASSSQAQLITWGTAQDMTGNPDISADGTYYDAASAFGTTTVNNGVAGVGGTNVPFNALTNDSTAPTPTVSDGTISVTVGDGVGDYGAAFTSSTPSSTSYSNLVNTGVFNAGATDTVTIGGPLIVGDTYQVEVWSYYSGDSSTATTDFSSTGGNTVDLLNQTGQFAIGTFVATANPEVFSFTADGGHGFINDISVFNETAAVPEPSTWAMMLGGLGLLAFCVRRKTALLK